METAALVAPVTALEFLQDAFLLTGEGPLLTVYSLRPRPKASASLSVLQHYRIHGARPRGLSSTTEPNFHDLAVFGGKAVRLVRLHVDLQGGDHLHLEILGPLMELQDWALDVRWLSGHKDSLLCVALAHNSALLLDVSTGTALVLRSCLEGCLLYSALLLVDKSWADAVLVGGTVFNQLVLWKPGDGEAEGYSKCKAPVERRLLGHSGVIFNISYLQERGWLASASDDRSVRVWGVGVLGGPGGKIGDLNPTCLRVLYGHQARVFSVRLSPGKVFSAGEDGACLAWDWAGGGKVVRTLKGHRAGGVRALAVSEATGDEERWVATGGADGGVRLWRLKETEESKEETEEAVTENLTDLKFPDHVMPKGVCVAGEEYENASWSQSKFVVCTDQGSVFQHRNGQWDILWQGTPDFQSYCVMETVSINVKDSTAKVNVCAVGNLSGSIQVFPISHPQSGILLTGGSGKIHSLIWQEGEACMCLLASGAEGLVYRWCIDVRLNENCSLSINANPLPPFLLPPCAKRWLLAAVCLHSRSQEALWVCGDRRGSLLLFQEEGKVVQKADDDAQADEGLLQPLSCLFGVHGKQGVTSVCEYQGLLYSTGRDGCVRVFRVQLTPPEKPEEIRKNSAGKTLEDREQLQLDVLRVQRACKGMEWLERVLFLPPEIPEEEGVGEECENHSKTKQSFRGEDLQADNKAREARFVIAGFHAIHFVVWDPVRQERLFAVPCGGGHRSWILWPSHKRVWPGYGALVFIKHGAVMASRPPGEEPTWAGRTERTGGWGLREGIHGRGIGCVCRLGRIDRTGNDAATTGDVTATEREQGHWEVVVTGGEDTSLSVLAVHPNSGHVKVLSVITDHISSIRTVAAVKHPAGQSKPQSLSVLLFSAGGRAQMCCYRLLIGWDGQRLVPCCQVIQVASHRLDERWEKRRNRHKTVKMDPETRYMSVEVVDERMDCVLLALACSDGAVRFFSVSEAKHRIDLLWEAFYHQRCVLSVATCSLEDEKGNRYKLLFSAATDGKIAVWDLTEASSSTDTSINAAAPPFPCLDIPAHQSGINSVAVWAEKLALKQDCCLVTIASGGDDGQLTVSTIRVQYPGDGKTRGSREFSQISEAQISSPTQFPPSNKLQIHLHAHSHIPLAHAAPVTAIKLLTPGIMFSTSSDQRVCLWRVCSTGISHRRTLCSHVADAAGLAVWEGQMIDKDEGDEKRNTTFESEEEIAVWRGEGIRTGLETEGEEGGRFYKETDDEAKGGEPVKAASETSDEREWEKRNQTESDSVAKRESEANTESGSRDCCESRKKGEKTGWVLVCGQGLQLFRIVLGLVQFGLMVTHLSEPLVRGYTTGAAFHIILSQLKYCFGISHVRHSGPLSLIYVSPQNTLITNTDNQQIHAYSKLESGNVWHLCLMNDDDKYLYIIYKFQICSYHFMLKNIILSCVCFYQQFLKRPITVIFVDDSFSFTMNSSTVCPTGRGARTPTITQHSVGQCAKLSIHLSFTTFNNSLKPSPFRPHRNKNQKPKYSLLGQVPGTDISKPLEDYNQYLPGILIFRSSATLYFANAEMYQDALGNKDDLRKDVKVKKKDDKWFRNCHQINSGNCLVLSDRCFYHNSQCAMWEPEQKDIAFVELEAEPEPSHPRAIILDLSPVNFLDTVGVKALQNIQLDYGQIGIEVVLAGCQTEVVDNVQTGGFFSDKVTKSCLFATIHDAVLYYMSREDVL
ncbi:putative WD repeat-containing protein 6 [Scophthalmus maximus]|uniref:tRNA (34-2'-O)-methyltransferase regulator WDR6 n=1 Tax=Scophthalmus maximus TaxID=52904 RepID=A0A2U9C0C0_SCOMX|nr:putative WD repeat-containing protein 6 [Scophthalmus maximus]